MEINMGDHIAKVLELKPPMARLGNVASTLVLLFALAMLTSGCTSTTDSTAVNASPPVPDKEIITDGPAPTNDTTPASSDLNDTEYSADEQQILYYGEVLAYRYGIKVSELEWLQVLDKNCASYSSSSGTRIYGLAAADELSADQRESLLLESFVFLVGGSFMCGSGADVSHLDRYGDEATNVYLAFTTTANDYAGVDLDVTDFEYLYDQELKATRDEYLNPPIPQDPAEYPGYDDSSSDISDEAPDTTDPSPDTEYEGNSGGPTMCDDGTISESSGSGTCSWHGGER